MNHSFDIEHARLYGLHESILIGNLQFWIGKNVANGTHVKEGRTWTYNSAKALALLFPYLTDRQIRRTIDSLVSQGVMVKGNFNERPADRTLWLAFCDEEQFVTVQKPSPKTANGAPKTAKQSPKTAHAIAENGESLIRADVNTDVNTDGEGCAQPHAIPADLLADFLQVRKAKKAGPLTKTALAGLQREADKAGLSLEAAVTACCEFGWQGFRADWYAERQAGRSAAAMTASHRNTNKHAAAAATIFEGVWND